jgi:ribosomal protein S18 acetylase RimI-like enzyme
LKVIPAGEAREAYLPLLLLADDSEAQVRSYYQSGDLFAYENADGAALGMTLAIPWDDGSVELKAVAVDQALHGRGIGQRMLAAVLAELRARGVRRVVLGTGTSGIGQLAFYQKAGFRFWRIERDFFTAERGYPEGLEENGIPLRDMVWLDQDL